MEFPRVVVAALLTAVLATACTSTEPPSPTVTYLTPAEHRARVAGAARGAPIPSIADLVAVTERPERLSRIVDDYLASPEFGATIRELHNEVRLLRHENRQLTPPPMPPLECSCSRAEPGHEGKDHWPITAAAIIGARRPRRPGLRRHHRHPGRRPRRPRHRPAFPDGPPAHLLQLRRQHPRPVRRRSSRALGPTPPFDAFIA